MKIISFKFQKREDLIKAFLKFKGRSKKITTYEENRKIRE